ncbi:hypothetical protein FRC18_012393 [Serendipita sp. 400]|nr:hypothetical protein FRC18_012393 [Serendipita sp. 400]
MPRLEELGEVRRDAEHMNDSRIWGKGRGWGLFTYGNLEAGIARMFWEAGGWTGPSCQRYVVCVIWRHLRADVERELGRLDLGSFARNLFSTGAADYISTRSPDC